METYVIIKDQFPAFHAWSACPYDEVAFLRQPHRHMFHIQIKIKVSHYNRDVEFFMIKNTLAKILHESYVNQFFGDASCEMLCKNIKQDLVSNYPILLNIHSIQVWEDGENGAEVIF